MFIPASYGDSVSAHYLISSHRIHDSSYTDSYFTCDVCGASGMQWLVNSQDAGVHLPSQSVGTVSYRNEPGDPTILNYLSIILAKPVNNASSCMHVLLIVTQTTIEFQERLLRVTCRGSTQQEEITYEKNTSISNFSNGTVFLSHVIQEKNVVNNIVTNILIGSTNESSLFWLRNQQPAGGFNGIHSAGDNEFRILPNDLSIVFRETVLLVKRLHDITSLLLLTDNSTSINISCVSDSNYISILLNNSDDSRKDVMQKDVTQENVMQESSSDMVATPTSNTHFTSTVLPNTPEISISSGEALRKSASKRIVLCDDVLLGVLIGIAGVVFILILFFLLSIICISKVKKSGIEKGSDIKKRSDIEKGSPIEEKLKQEVAAL